MHEQLSLLDQGKICPSCGVRRHLDEYHRDRGKRDGHTVICKPCASAAAKARYRANPEPAKARARRWQIANRDRVNELHRARRAKDPVRFTVMARRWKHENRDAWREQKRRNARNGRVGRGEHEVAYAEVLDRDPCAYCGGQTDTIDHITAVAVGGSNAWSNLTASCRSCNSTKNTKSLLTYLLLRKAAS